MITVKWRDGARLQVSYLCDAGVMIGNTDTINYLHLTPHVYRFVPAMITSSEVAMVHGHNEKISVSSLIACVSFYHHLILAADVQPPQLKTQPGHRAGEL